MLTLDKYSMGIGDRFARQGRAQLAAMQKAAQQGVDVTPVWNKSHREHTTIGTAPGDVRKEADAAVAALGWGGAYFVDADHIGQGNVDLFLDASDFFTLDVADFTGRPAAADAIRAFVDRHRGLAGELALPGLDTPLTISGDGIADAAGKFLLAVQEAAAIYRRIEKAKGAGRFVTEVSMDETDRPQTPEELLVILAAVADEGIPAQTIAPKFTGRFNKGVDYVGDVAQFTREFEADLAVIAYAVANFGLPGNLKLSVHSGSDKFSIYGPIREALAKTGAGLHLKTAGTTWLEELIGLALAGGEGLDVARDVYAGALVKFDELCAPYASVIDIDKARLPSAEEVRSWTGDDYAAALRHEPGCPAYNSDFRQLLHVGYKVAAKMGERYLSSLDAHEPVIAEQVTTNILERHLLPVFGVNLPGHGAGERGKA